MTVYRNEWTGEDDAVERACWFRDACGARYVDSDMLRSCNPFVDAGREDDVLLFLHFTDWGNEGLGGVSELSRRYRMWCQERAARVFVVVYSGHWRALPELEGLPEEYVRNFEEDCCPEAPEQQEQRTRLLAFAAHVRSLDSDRERKADWSVLNPLRDAIARFVEMLVPLDILLQGALVLFGARDGRPWSWCDSPTPQVFTEEQQRAMAARLCEYRDNPLGWFCACATDMKVWLFDEEPENVLDRCASKDEHAKVTLRSRLLGPDGSPGALLRVASAVAGGRMELCPTVLSNPEFLKEAHQEFSALTKDIS